MPKKLLLADDSITIQKVVAITFASEDYTLTTVDNGEDAVNRARDLNPDVILADVVMPRRNGYEVCEAVKADPSLKHIPVLLLAGTFEAFDEARARAASADGHIQKPFDSQTLIDRVNQLVLRGAPATAAAPADAVQAPQSQPLAAPFSPARVAAAVPPAQGLPRPPQSFAPAPRPPGVGVPPGARPPAPGVPMGARPPAPGGPAAARPPPGARPPVPGALGALGGLGAPGARPAVPGMPTAARPPAPGMPGGARPPIPGALVPGAARPAIPGVPAGVRPPLGGIPPPPAPGRPVAPGMASAPAGAKPVAGGARPAKDPFGLGMTIPQPRPGAPARPPVPAPGGGPMPRGAPVGAPRVDGGEALLREALTRASREVIEKIAWEVVPQLAETIIREELDRLIKERDAKV